VGEEFAGSSFDFTIRLTSRWPFVDPQFYLSPGNVPSYLADGRDLYNEIVGQDGWKKNYSLTTLVTIFPDYIEEILNMEVDREHVIGRFHQG
jgi:hypothetical protein